VWEVDFELASQFIGGKFEPQEVETAFGARIQPIDGGSKWFVIEFIESQQKCSVAELQPQRNNAHLAIVRILTRVHLYDSILGVGQAPVEPPIGGSGKGKGKGKGNGNGNGEGKGKGKAESENQKKIAYADNVWLTEDQYEKLLARLGSKQRVVRAIEILDSYKGQSEKNKKKYTDDYRAILNWVVGRLEEDESKQKGPTSNNAESLAKQAFAILEKEEK
jgi:hypothetical protein